MMTYKKILTMVAMFLACSAWSNGSSANIIKNIVVHNQTTLNDENLFLLPSDGRFGETITFLFEITNGTNITWTDYHFHFFTLAGGAAFLPDLVKIGNIQFPAGPSVPFNIAQINLNDLPIGGVGPEHEARLTMHGGKVKPGQTFEVQLDLAHKNSVSITGVPSVSVPEPPPLVFFLAGLLGICALRYTTMKARVKH